jgi:polysaccharide biosynthesis transport protein
MSAANPWNLNDPARAGGLDAPGSDLDIQKVLFGRKLLLLLLTAIGVGLGYQRFTQAPEVFSSTARLRIFRSQPILRDSDNRAASQPSDLMTQGVLMTSPEVVDLAVRQGQLNELPSIGAANPVGAVSGGLVTERFKGGAAVSNELLDVSFIGRHPDDCRRVLNAVIQAYATYLDQSQETETESAVRLIKEARDTLTTDLRRKENEYSQFRAQAELVWQGGQGRNLFQDRMAQTESARSKLIIELTQAKAELQNIDSALAAGASREALLLMVDQSMRERQEEALKDGDASAATANRSPFSELIPLMLQEDELLQKVGAGHPKVREVRRKIEIVQAMLQQEQASRPMAVEAAPVTDWLDIYFKSLRQQVVMLEQKVDQLNKLFETQRAEALKLSAQEDKDRMMAKDIERSDRLFEAVVAQLEQMNLAKDASVLKVQTVVPPGNGRKIGPDLVKYLAAGGCLGFLAAISLSFLFELTDKSFRNIDDVSRRTGLPVLGIVPRYDPPSRQKQLRDRVVSPTVIAFHQPESYESESFRLVRSGLFLSAGTKGHRVVQVTSPDPADGKSTTAANLATSIAMAGKSCLLIDADCRRPTMHRLMGLPNTVGLTSVLRDECELVDAIQKSNIENLDVLTAGPRVNQPSELLLSPQFRSLLATLREKYDLVLIDTPPVLVVSDPAIVSQHVDGVLVVVRLSRQARPHTERAVKSLRQADAKLSGVIVNQVDRDTESYAYGYGYRYGSGYHRYENAYKTYGDEKSTVSASGSQVVVVSEDPA